MSPLFFGVNLTALAGSLELPGPPGPTFKTLGEIEARRPVKVNDGYGILIEGANITIRNGTVRNADLDGIKCADTLHLVKLINVSSIHNTGNGVSCRYVQISHGDFSSNGGAGISGYNMLIENVRASENTGTGIGIGGRTLVTRSMINGNGGW